ncbi:hypothetical protein N7495_005112 [Penicillium taxi]|uniref:uncharacterized protein n=1 Tax=Penicillium taxi TaxID=168475 RepID=UPI00254571B3|nr:uncharacterized protein N7495_005112 [Penicillium taxi]KAJ5893421.1 hypothetical protein N7495_005112 [Penicillium taxi]
MIYGYNSKLSSHGVDKILNYGRELMEEIKKIWNTKDLQQRPLIFIAHSFGGIILAHCLVKAIQTMKGDHPAIASLYQATYCMILFAIPHKGLVIDDIQQMLIENKNHPRGHLLQQISIKSDLLIHQLADFKNLIRDRKVVSFYETEQTRRLELLAQTQRFSSCPVPLHADHSMLVKFDTRNAAGYQTALNKLQQFLKDAPLVVAARFMQTCTKPQPCSTVPFKKDPMFIGREAVISAIKNRHKAIGQSHERVALVGLAGVRKTQTAIEYSYRVRESTPDIWVFWIHASNAARLEQGYQQIAVVAEIPGRDDLKTNIFQLVYQWLCDTRNGRWIMVLDNADDNSIFFSSNTCDERGRLVRFLPRVTHGSLLITSRNTLTARNLVGSDGDVIEVQPMNEEESLALLRARIPTPQPGGSIEDEKALVEALEYIPLAITQAGSYIANQLPLLTISSYLQLFHESESKQTRLLQNEDSADLRRDSSIRYMVITTWQLSFEQILIDHPEATDLLSLLSMFDRQGIPEDLVRDSYEDILDFHDALAPLLSYFLIRLQVNERSFDMHRLVQLSTCTSSSKPGKPVHDVLWHACFQVANTKAGHNFDYSSCMLKGVLNSIYEEDFEDKINVAKLSFNCGVLLYHERAYDEAEAMHRQALEAKGKVIGYNYPSTLGSASTLGYVLSKQGKYEEAEAMNRRALEANEKALGHNHPSTLISVNSLGLVLYHQGKNEEAEAMHRRALEAAEKVLGREHLDTLTHVYNLALVLNSQGKYEEAETMYRRALEASEKALGHNHPTTLSSISDLGSVLFKHGKYQEAEAMHRQTLKAREKVLGRDHPNTLTSVNELGKVLESQGKYEEAETMYRRALKAREKGRKASN